MTDLTKSKRAVALRIATILDNHWPNMTMEGFDVDEATDLIEGLIPLSAAEAEAEMDAMRDDEPPAEPVVNPTLRAFKDAVGCGPVPMIVAIKDATEKLTFVKDTLARIAKLQYEHYADDWESVALHAEQLSREAIEELGQ